MSTKLTKILGLSLLAIVGILAVNASAAQATWTLLRNGSAVNPNLINLNAELLEGELLVKELLTIKCTGGTATAHLTGGATLSGSAHALFTGCSVLDFPDCEVKSPGTAVGTILASGSGTGALSGTSVSTLVASTKAAPFSTVKIENELCPFDNTNEPIFGGATLLLLNAATNTADHLAHLNDDGLKFGERDAFIDGLTLNPTTLTDTVLAHVTAQGGGTWAIDHS